MKRRLIIYFLIVFIVGLSNSLLADDQSQKVLATIGDEKITFADLEERLKLIMPSQAMLKNKKVREDTLNQMLQTRLLAKEARSLGIDKERECALKIEEMTSNYLAQEYVKREILDRIKIGDDEIQGYYREHLKEFIEPEKIRARHILVKVNPKGKPEDEMKAESKAKELLNRVEGGEDFAELAREFSEDPNTKAKGGDLWYFSRGRMTPEFEKIAFKLKVGEISPIVKTVFGFHIIKVEDKKLERVLEFNQVKNQIEKILKDKRQRSEMDNHNRQLMEKYRVLIDKEALQGE